MALDSCASRTSYFGRAYWALSHDLESYYTKDHSRRPKSLRVHWSLTSSQSHRSSHILRADLETYMQSPTSTIALNLNLHLHLLLTLASESLALSHSHNRTPTWLNRFSQLHYTLIFNDHGAHGRRAAHLRSTRQQRYESRS